MKGTVREGKEGKQNDILHKLLKQMGHRYKENGKEEEEKRAEIGKRD